MTHGKSNTEHVTDSDRLLTDHEWRLKMAAEGKAIYVPGRSDEEVKANLKKKQLVGLEAVDGGFKVINQRTGEARFVADESQTFDRPKATKAGPVNVPVPTWPDYPDAISPIEAWEQAQAVRCGNHAKTPEQQEPAMINFSVTEDQYRKFQQATGEAPYLLEHAGHVFDFLVSLQASGFAGDESGVLSIMELCARAFRNAAAQEGEALAELDRVMRHDWAKHQQSLQPSV